MDNFAIPIPLNVSAQNHTIPLNAEAVPTGTTDYNHLTNRPSLNGVVIEGAHDSEYYHLYSVPETGIPKTDLASGVQESLDKADTALQEDDLEELTEEVDDLKSAINTKAPVIIDTASGAIASFEDGADGLPIKSLTVNIEPVQSGTGDPSPENVRSITGWTGCNIHVSPTTTGGTVYPIAFPSEAAPVYGGTLELPSCVLTVNMGIVDVGDLTIGAFDPEKHIGAYSITDRAYGSNVNLPSICSMYKFFGYSSATGLTDYLENGQYGFQRSSRAVRIRDDRFSNENDFVAAMSGVKIVYYLEEPRIYQLALTEITTLLGTNNIWTDCGPVSVDYPADTKLYIQKINAPTDDDMTAGTHIASGKYFIIGNNLYLSTTTIPAGDTIIPGTNCTKTDLAAALNALNT